MIIQVVSTMAFTTTLLVISVTMVMVSLAVSCPSECDCPLPTIVDCSSRRLTSIPQDIPESTIILYLYENDISTIDAGAFSNLSSLQDLYIYGNNLTTLPLGIFDALRSLLLLSLGINDITALNPGVFRELASLQSLSISSNDLDTLPEGIFTALQSLESMSIRDNYISALDPGVFSELFNLQVLDMGYNGLATLPGGVFSDLRSLEELHLHENNITELDPGVFSDLVNLQTLNIDGNHLTTLPEGVFDQLTPTQGIIVNFINNPWNCDCKIRWLQHATYDKITGLDEIICKTPSFHASEPLINIQPQHLICPPVIQVEIQLDVTPGNRVELLCPATGDPSPRIDWMVSDYGNGKQTNVQSTQRVHLNGSLTIGNTTESDSGIYTCTATNTDGSDSIMYRLNVVLSIDTTMSHSDLPLSSIVMITMASALVLLLIVVAMLVVFIVIKQRRQPRTRDVTTDGIQGYDTYIPEVRQNETTNNQEEIDYYDDCITTQSQDERQHETTHNEVDYYYTIDGDDAVLNAQPEHIALAQINRNIQPE